MTAYTMTIAGEAISAAETFEVIDPATGKSFARAPSGALSDLDRAIDSAESAFAIWKRDQTARRQALVACADAIRDGAEPLARVLSLEQGKSLKDALREVLGSSGLFRYYATVPLAPEVTYSDQHLRVEVHRRPYGVVGAITPWNYPLLIACNKLAPALLAGNTLVLKPSPYTPLSSLELGGLLRRVLPPGVLNVVSGGDAVGQRISEHPTVRKISFTGSVATGKKVALAAAPDLKRVTLELGGNDPAIVLGDVDPRAIARALFWGAFTNSGQVCTAIKRLYVHESLLTPLAEALAEVARDVKVGPGLESGSVLGPVNNLPQYERVSALYADAERRGAQFYGAGPRAGEGYFFEPTLVTNIADDAPLVAEEQFGPLLPLLPFRDVDEVMARANASHFGLSASIWTRDLERGASLAGELDCGTVWINQHMVLGPYAPFGGQKWSGIGYENGRWGLDSFCQLQALNVSLG